MKYRSPHARRQGFTLIELMVVITIIAILAAMSIGVFTFAQQKAHRDITTTWSTMLVQALGQYNEKFGEFPDSVNQNSSTTLGQSTTIAGATYDIDGALVLYQAITGDGTDQLLLGSTVKGTTSDGTITADEAKNAIVTDLPKQMTMKVTTGSGDSYIIVDGFSRPFQYFKGKAADGSNTPVTVNPKYDLWSYAQITNGDGGGGSMPFQYQDRISTTGHVNAWIKNW